MSGRLITWSEIQQHTSIKDRWIVVEDKVYDVSRWQNRHPGGRKIIGHYEGQDATEAFRAFHPGSAQVHKYLKALYVGDLDVYSIDPSKISEKEKRDVYVKDFEELRLKMVELGLFKGDLFFFGGMLAHVFLFEALAYLNLLYFGVGVFQLTLSILFYTIAQIDKDPDIRLEPVFVVGDTLPVRAASEDGPWKKHMPYSYQDIYFYFIGPPLLFPVYFQFMSFRHIFVRKCWEDLAWVMGFFGKLFFFYHHLLGFWGTLGYFLAVRVGESIWFTMVSQSNHVPMEVSYDRNEAWLPMQCRATCNVEQSLFNDWFTGHLNFQLEHHLFPTMPRHNFSKAQPYVIELCNKHNLEYPVKSLSTAFGDIVRALRKAAVLWNKAKDANKVA